MLLFCQGVVGFNRPRQRTRRPLAVHAAQVNSLTSFETELPYEYYTMPFCKPEDGVKRISDAANLGTVLMGIRIENSMYNFTMMVCGTEKLLKTMQGRHGATSRVMSHGRRSRAVEHA